ncbi:DUF3306 domain-containing protein [Vibrio cortegadensis]|uniref:DUF3306 domain-containing protein n=1 Tax=Vibrio cortegadensis TaxID=1328770 RepID=UPI0021C2F3E2|nr:DUF3306 domain-containing protein [Vibrio cortegadensis]MDN3696864.1 DUF3306 domain-containing protein [Vibrio cortegadensis]
MATNFLSRWSQRKLSNKEEPVDKVDLDVGNEVVPDALGMNETDSDLIATELNTITTGPNTSKESGVNETGYLESDHPETESSGDVVDASVTDLPIAELLTTGAEASVKKAALRKLFLSGEFSEVDALNDYDHDYKAVKTLSKEVAETLRGWAKEIIEDDPEDIDQPQETALNEEADNIASSAESNSNETHQYATDTVVDEHRVDEHLNDNQVKHNQDSMNKSPLNENNC